MKEQFGAFFQNYQQPALLFTLAGEILAINPSAEHYFSEILKESNAISEIRKLLKNIQQDLLNNKSLSLKKKFLGYYGNLNFSLVNFSSETAVLLLFEPKRGISKTWVIDQVTLDKVIQGLVHELKAPLVSIFGFTSALQEDYVNSLDQQALDYLESVIRGAKRLDDKLVGLAELTQVVNRAKKKEVVNFREILHEAYLEVKPILERCNAEFTTVTDFPVVFCNRSLMVKVIVNLIANAIKFTPLTQRPFIEIGYKANSKEHQFWVRDQAIGIDNKMQKKVFEPFYRIKELQKVEGIGLGLALVRRIIEAHNGRVWVDSQPKEGSCFYFSLPS